MTKDEIDQMREDALSDLRLCESVGGGTRLEQRAADVIKLVDALTAVQPATARPADVRDSQPTDANRQKTP